MLGSGPRGLGFKSRHSDHVVADCISFATTFLLKCHLSLIPSLLLSKTGHVRFGCSLVNALAMVRCRYQPFAGVPTARFLSPIIPLAPRRSKVRFAPPLPKGHACSGYGLAGAAMTPPRHYQPFAVAAAAGGGIFFVTVWHLGASDISLAPIFMLKIRAHSTLLLLINGGAHFMFNQ